MMLRARRLVYVFSAFLMLALGGLLLRLAWLHVAGSADALERRDHLADGASLELARRGALHDRHGQVIADSVEELRVTSYARDITHEGRTPRPAEDVARSVQVISTRLSPLLRLPPDRIAPQLVKTGDDGRPVQGYVGDPVTDPAAIDALLAAQDGDLRRIGLESRWERRDPIGAAAGNLLGIVNFEGHGAFGLETGLDKVLSCGVDGRYPQMKLGSFRVADAGRDPVASLSGYDVELTLDTVVQRILHEELVDGCTRLHAVGGSAVMLDVATGDILGIDSAPGLDPTDSRTWTKEAQVFRPTQTVYSPGSTFKPVMLSMALDLGIVKPDEHLDTSAARGIFGTRHVTDTHPIHGPASLEDIIVASSNIGMSNILTRLVPVGRGERPRADAADLRAPGAARRAVADRCAAARRVGRPADAAGPVDPQLHAGLGLLRPRDLGHAPADGLHRRLAGRRPLAPPAAGLGLHGRAGHRVEMPTEAPVPVFRPETVDLVRGYMRSVIDKGQAKTAAVPGLSVAGKTGTTVPDHPARPGEPPAREVHSFIALAPADKPVIALVVVIDGPQGFRYAAETVAPVTGAILRRALPYLGIAAEAR